jgi:predicted transcriptional regulator of viral defense system
MKLLDVHTKLMEMDQTVFQTSDAAACLGIDNGHASKLLARLAASGHGVRLARGLWASDRKIDPLILPEYLTVPFPSYVSLQSALYYHGMTSQIPAVTYAVSVGRTRRFETPLGTISVHHMDASLFFGYESVGKSGVKMATAEKAILDVLYLSPARSKLFRALPELELPKTFRIGEVRAMLKRIKDVKRRTLVHGLFDQIVASVGRR